MSVRSMKICLSCKKHDLDKECIHLKICEETPDNYYFRSIDRSIHEAEHGGFKWIVRPDCERSDDCLKLGYCPRFVTSPDWCFRSFK